VTRAYVRIFTYFLFFSICAGVVAYVRAGEYFSGEMSSFFRNNMPKMEFDRTATIDLAKSYPNTSSPKYNCFCSEIKQRKKIEKTENNEAKEQNKNKKERKNKHTNG